MKTLFETIKTALHSGSAAVLCSIIASAGSTPRGAGAKMAVFADGTITGTIGGGAVEYQAIQTALELHRTQRASTQLFRLHPNEVADLGMICGGNVTVYFQYLSPTDTKLLSLLDAVCTLFQQGDDAWLLTRLEEGTAPFAVYSKTGGLVGDSALSVAELLPLLQNRPVLHSGAPSYYAEPLVQAGTVYVFGGGHVSRELVPVLTHLGFRVVVLEDRADFAQPALFPTAEQVLLCDYNQINASISIRPSDSIVILTRGHQGDFALLAQALQTEASYIGCIGSRTKSAATNRHLRDAGFSDDAIARIHTPIGLSIGAETPAEIAVSIAGELIRHRAKQHSGQK